jgi:purine-binding chemotaxis protein CheW
VSSMSEASGLEYQEFVTLVSGGQSFCLEITQIREIRRWSPITLLPHAPSVVRGVINLRGVVIPIVDLADRLGLGHTDDSARCVIIVAQARGRTFGLLVDSVSEIVTVRSDQVREPPDLKGFEAAGCLRGLVEIEGDMARLIDLQAIMPAFAEAATA